MRELLDLYLSFFKMGAVTFGGGYTMLPILKRECVESKRWVSDEQVMDFYAVSQGLPGIIAVNVAVFIGYHVRRTAGGIAAALGCVSPCIIIISIIAAFLTNFQDNIYVKEAMNGIAICVVALILDAVLGLWKKGVKDKLGVALCAAVFVLMELTSISPIPVIVGAALLGVVCKTLAAKKEAAK